MASCSSCVANSLRFLLVDASLGLIQFVKAQCLRLNVSEIEEVEMAENKTVPTRASVQKFIAAIESERRQADARTALKIYKEVTGKRAVMWGPSIIGFGKHHYKYDSGREGIMPEAGFSPRKANMTFYVGDKFKGAAALYKKLGKHKKSVACLYVNKLDDVDLDVLREIVSRDYQKTIAAK